MNTSARLALKEIQCLWRVSEAGNDLKIRLPGPEEGIWNLLYPRSPVSFQGKNRSDLQGSLGIDPCDIRGYSQPFEKTTPAVELIRKHSNELLSDYSSKEAGP